MKWHLVRIAYFVVLAATFECRTFSGGQYTPPLLVLQEAHNSKHKHNLFLILCACILSSIRLRGEPTCSGKLSGDIIFFEKFSRDLVRGRCPFSQEVCRSAKISREIPKKKNNSSLSRWNWLCRITIQLTCATSYAHQLLGRASNGQGRGGQHTDFLGRTANSVGAGYVIYINIHIVMCVCIYMYMYSLSLSGFPRPLWALGRRQVCHIYIYIYIVICMCIYTYTCSLTLSGFPRRSAHSGGAGYAISVYMYIYIYKFYIHIHIYIYIVSVSVDFRAALRTRAAPGMPYMYIYVYI